MSDLDLVARGDVVTIQREDIPDLSGQVLAVSDRLITVIVGPKDARREGDIVSVARERIGSLTRRGTAPLPPSLLRSYKGKQQSDTTQQLRAEAADLAKVGYRPSSQSWAPGQWGSGAFVVAALLCSFWLASSSSSTCSWSSLKVP